MPVPTTDPVTAFLALVRERIARRDELVAHMATAAVDARTFNAVQDRLAECVSPLLAALEAVAALHHDDSYGRCVVCREFCDCFDGDHVVTAEDWGRAAMDCPHGNEPWPCPTVQAVSTGIAAKRKD